MLTSKLYSTNSTNCTPLIPLTPNVRFLAFIYMLIPFWQGCWSGSDCQNLVGSGSGLNNKNNITFKIDFSCRYLLFIDQSYNTVLIYQLSDPAPGIFRRSDPVKFTRIRIPAFDLYKSFQIILEAPASVKVSRNILLTRDTLSFQRFYFRLFRGVADVSF